MQVLMRCVGRAVAAKGVRGLLGDLLPGEILFGVAEGVRRQLSEEELRDELWQVVEPIPANELDFLAEEVSHEFAAGQSAEVQQALTRYLTAIPATVRQALKRPDDTSGTTVPNTLSLSRPED